MSFHTADPICFGCEQKLLNADPRLGDWFRHDVKPNFPDAHISVSFRDQIDQNQAVLDKKSQLQWPKSAHNNMQGTLPYARALDLFEQNAAFPNGKWDPKFFTSLNSYNIKNGISLRWGGIFKSIGDFDHFEMIN